MFEIASITGGPGMPRTCILHDDGRLFLREVTGQLTPIVDSHCTPLEAIKTAQRIYGDVMGLWDLRIH